MSRVNKKDLYGEISEKTHEGAPAKRISVEQALRRSVMACLLWEDSFYESGHEISERIADLVKKVPAEKVSSIALEARSVMNLRHVPLLLAREMARTYHGKIISSTINSVIQRADELAEFLAIYWKDKRQPLSKQVRVGLAEAFGKFDEYELAKYNKDDAVKLRDVLFLSHAKPKDVEQANGTSGKSVKIPALSREDYKRGPVLRHPESVLTRLVEGTIATPDTWEVALSAGKNKKETWERLISEKKLGALALLRNLRNMSQAGVPRNIVKEALSSADYKRILPFRFVAAALAAPEYEEFIDEAFLKRMSEMPKIPGRTVVVIDVSGSMYGAGNISKHSDMSRIHAACALGAIFREVCEEPVIYATAGNDGTRIHKTALVPNRRGMALVDAIDRMREPLGGGGIFLTPVMRWIKDQIKTADRTVVFTDEQDCAVASADSPIHAEPMGKNAYLINISVEKNGIGYGGKWTHIDGFSENVVRYILENEKTQ